MQRWAKIMNGAVLRGTMQGAPKVEQVADKSDKVADQPSRATGREY